MVYNRINSNFHDLAIFYRENEDECFEGQGEYFRLVLVETGSGFIGFNGVKRLLMAPAILCLNETDRVDISGVSDLAAESILFHPQLINENLSISRIRENAVNSVTERLDFDSLKPFVKTTPDYTGQYQVGPATFQRVKQLIGAISRQLNHPPDKFWPCRSRSYLLELLFLIFQISISKNQIEELPINNQSGDAEQIILYLVRNYQRKITVDELMKKFNLSRNALYQKFHQTTGVPLITYLIGLRIKLATILLKETSLPVAEIMEKTGYSDLTHFGRIFKKVMGCTPVEYRKMNGII